MGDSTTSSSGCLQSDPQAPAHTNNSTQERTEGTVPKKTKFVGKRKLESGDSLNTASKSLAGSKKPISNFGIPDEIIGDERLIEALKVLPKNYNFEIPKTIWRIRQLKSKAVALQFPEGLQMFSCIIADIIEQFCPEVEEVVIMGDVTYGACCVDDYTARALGCDFLVHYGHSCLVPLQLITKTLSDNKPFNILYVFVDIGIDVDHFVESVKLTFPSKSTQILLVSTIQFASSLQISASKLNEYYENSVIVPQEKPLSPGEILGCTSPKIAPNLTQTKSKHGSNPNGTDDVYDSENVDNPPKSVLLYLGDGRFHLESIMISNPSLEAYRYDPYQKVFTFEKYHTEKMMNMRHDEIERARSKVFQSQISANTNPSISPQLEDIQSSSLPKVGIILGTLGRQGSPNVLNNIEETLKSKSIPYIIVLLSEIFPWKLSLFHPSIEAWVQIACPRLSIDWGKAFSVPLLNPYEAQVAFGNESWRSEYPMDFYSKQGGSWSVYHTKP